MVMHTTLKSAQWLDNMPDPLDTVGDVEELFRLVEIKKAKLAEAAIHRASLN